MPTTTDTLVDLLEAIVVGSVGITTRALANAMPGLDLTFPQWRALLVVGEGEDGATVSAVAARVGVTLPATSRQLARLARRGLVELRPDERDRRASRARLTPAGRAQRDAIVRYRRDRLTEIARGMRATAATRRDLAAVVTALEAYR
jgi:DNA-binding MarR family transcriptional regulator